MTASDEKEGAGSDIGKMFQRQEHVLSEWKVDDVEVSPSNDLFELQQAVEHDGNSKDETANGQGFRPGTYSGSEDVRAMTQESLNDDDEDETWKSEDQTKGAGEVCDTCGAVMPAFAMMAHVRFHSLYD